MAPSPKHKVRLLKVLKRLHSQYLKMRKQEVNFRLMHQRVENTPTW